jgi:hypothetical protein
VLRERLLACCFVVMCSSNSQTRVAFRAVFNAFLSRSVRTARPFTPQRSVTCLETRDALSNPAHFEFALVGQTDLLSGATNPLLSTRASFSTCDVLTYCILSAYARINVLMAWEID